MKRISAPGLPALRNLQTFRQTLLCWVAPALLTVVAAAPQAEAAGYDNTQGDFILGFREVGSTTSILVDIGPITDFTAVQSFPLNTLGSALTSIYGSDWPTNANVYFSLAATTRPQDVSSSTNYVTSPEYPAQGLPAVVWPRLTPSNSTVLKNKIIKCGDNFNTFTVASGTNAVLEPVTSPDAYQNFMPGGTTDNGHASQANDAWGFFNPTSEGNFQSGVTGVNLHLIQLVPGSPTTDGTDLGNFTLSADGNTLTFTPAGSVSPTPTPTATPTPTPTATPTPTPGLTPTPTPTPTATPEPTATPTPEPTATPTPEPTATPTPEPTATPTPTPNPRRHPKFFKGQASLDNGVYYLSFANGNPFGYYTYLSDSHYIYHFDLGYEYVIDAHDSAHGVYLYDFASQTFWYSSPTFPFPYLYDFSLNAVLYYYPDVPADGRYTHNPRYFYDLTHGMIITK